MKPGDRGEGVNAILLGAGRPYKGAGHSALKSTGGDAIILDWITSALSAYCDRIDFVGGYEIESIKKKYPNLNYFYNAEWESTKSAGSLLVHNLAQAKQFVVAYVDIAFRSGLVADILKGDADITVATDSTWKSRYGGRDERDIQCAEKVSVNEGVVTKLGKDISVQDATAEFVGLVRFSSRAVDYIRHMNKGMVKDLSLRSLVELIESMRLRGFTVGAVESMGDWAELNDPRDRSKFVLGTKAETLQRLQNIVTRSKILDQECFSVEDWENDPGAILERLSAFFEGNRVIVRSSALAEDNFCTANAGAFESVLDVDSKSEKALKIAVEAVISSYPRREAKDQVLVQRMLGKIKGSGVIFTRGLQNGAPYYIINYDDQSQSTESVTSGNSSDFKTYKVLRSRGISELLPIDLQNLLLAVQEIENLFGHDRLDIEFAISTSGEVNILQVRPIVVDHTVDQSIDRAVEDYVSSAKEAFANLQQRLPQIVGGKAIFGSMPDWNPAEIIGVRPDRLTADLYDELIMTDIWARQRAEYGYRDVRPFGLMKFFAGQPYVDIRASFNSFIPKEIDDELAGRFVDFYLAWLEGHPELHDKIEFEVIPTCYDLSFNKWSARLIDSQLFSVEEVDELKRHLKSITNRAISGAHGAIADLENLVLRHKLIMDSELSPLLKARSLLADTKKFGTLAFAHLARDGFVAVALLKSGVQSGALSPEALEDFMEGLNSITHTLTKDASSVRGGSMSWESFVEKYGHLRPDSYNIKSERYKSNPDFFLRPIVEGFKGSTELSKRDFWQSEKIEFFESLISLGIGSSAEEIEDFLVSSIEGREYSKFLFSRGLSDALELIAEFGHEVGLDRKQLSCLPLHFIFDCENKMERKSILARSKVVIEDQLFDAEIYSCVELPPLIFSERDFDFFLLPKTLGNFIGEKLIVKESIFLNTHDQGYDLSDKVVLIENADPGYDWLFGRNIAGLVTKYGGANSHMAIRTAEFGLPAVIGVGEQKFNEVLGASIVEIDCSNMRLRQVR